MPVELSDEEYEELLEKIDKMESTLQSLRSLLLVEEELEAHWQLLKEVHDRGDVVSREEFYEIAEQLGYDRRGASGFLAGRKSGWRSKVQRIGEDRYALTPEAIEQLRSRGII